MIFTDDPIKDFNAHEAMQKAIQASLPSCDICGEPITDDYYYDLNGEIYCERCMDYYRKPIEMWRG